MYDNASHSLSEAQIGLKNGFSSIFVISMTKFRILKCVFCPFLGAKMTEIEIKIPKLIVTNDYDNFWHILAFKLFL